jgi:hypothetical protein
MDSRLGRVARAPGDAAPPPASSDRGGAAAGAAGAAGGVGAPPASRGSGASKPTSTCCAALTGIGAAGRRGALDTLREPAPTLLLKLKREGPRLKDDAASPSGPALRRSASATPADAPSPGTRDSRRDAALPREPIGRLGLRAALPTGGEHATCGDMMTSRRAVLARARTRADRRRRRWRRDDRRCRR